MEALNASVLLVFTQGDVFDRIRTRSFKKDVAAIFGTVKDEGTYWLPYYMSRYGFCFNHTISAEDPQNRALITREQYRQSMKAFMPYFGGSALVEHALLHAYQSVSTGFSPQENLRDGVGRFLGDYFFTCSLIEFADIIADNVYGPVYMYYFTMRSVLFPSLAHIVAIDHLSNRRSTANPWPKWMGVMHGYEIEYAFGQPLSRPSLYEKNYLRTEQRFSEFIMKLWIDFANTGTPATYWPKYNRIDRQALELGEESTRGDHRIMVDVHGSYCRLIDEAKTVAGQGTTHSRGEGNDNDDDSESASRFVSGDERVFKFYEVRNRADVAATELGVQHVTSHGRLADAGLHLQLRHPTHVS
ncbi:unnamed protein product [Angiostrongylus costaricensis]|uniref:Acetylcholinesterase n=1 Tax=Angiostrongylus costaricensis TaxID=334426 RepID=A0A158PKV5_ANGCS|nr:unnamed protein product [Angiostrongylus costaricensis]